MTAAIKTVADLGFAVGTADAGMRESCLPFHRKYINASEDVQATMRRDFKVSYVVGNAKCSYEVATEAVDAGKRGAGDLATNVNRAAVACTTWLVNGGERGASAGHSKKVKISAEQRALLEKLDALCTTYGDMRAICNAYIGAASK